MTVYVNIKAGCASCMSIVIPEKISHVLANGSYNDSRNLFKGISEGPNSSQISVRH